MIMRVHSIVYDCACVCARARSEYITAEPVCRVDLNYTMQNYIPTTLIAVWSHIRVRISLYETRSEAPKRMRGTQWVKVCSKLVHMCVAYA